ncbi:hypothetical protein QOZ80_1BG0050870 [Eleusine coracana subsp. coracana]|nr:hypothetical protein QOZ80_1BG0050870 [Eleusine coracana subsp. coracana]
MSFRGAVAAIRLRRLLSFLRRHGLYDTAHSLETRTGVFFDAPHLRRMLLAGRWAAASTYVLGFVKVGDCSREADTLLFRIRLLRVMADLAAGRAPALFQRLYDSLDGQPDCHHLQRILQSMRSDRSRAFRLYHRLKPMAVQVVLNLIANCPELKGKTQLPHCTLDRSAIMSLAPGFLGCSRHLKSKAVRIPANILALSFLRKRPRLIVHELNHSGSSDEIPLVLHQGDLTEPLCSQGFLSAPVLQDLQATSPGPDKSFSILPAANKGMDHSIPDDADFLVNFEQDFDPRKEGTNNWKVW